MAKTAEKIIKQAQAWIGYNEQDGTHKQIIDLYNTQKPLPRGYKVKYTSAWCATFVSAVSIACGMTDIVPTECSCERMIEKFKKLGVWHEDENYTPKPGDIVFYEWDDNGKGDNKAWADHVGIVEKVEGTKITVIEGNYSKSVKRRVITVNQKYLRGYAIPKYETEAVEQPKKAEVKKVKATGSAHYFDKKYNKGFTATGNVWMRHGAGIFNKAMVVIPKDTKIRCYGYYGRYLGVVWYYAVATVKGVQYTGFTSSRMYK